MPASTAVTRILVGFGERERLGERMRVVAAETGAVRIGRRRVQADDDVHDGVSAAAAAASDARLAASSSMTASAGPVAGRRSSTSAGMRGERGVAAPSTAPTRLRGVPEIAAGRPPTASTMRGTAIAIAGAAATASTTTTPAGAAADSFASAAAPSDGSTTIRIDASAAAAYSSTSGRQLRDAHLRGGDAGDHLDLDLFAAAIGGRAARRQDRDDRPLELDRIEAAVRRPIAAPAAHEDAADAVGERRRRFADLQVGAGGERAAQARRQARAQLRPGAAGREQDQQRRDPLDRGVQGRAVGQVEGRCAEAGALAGQHLVRAGAAQAGGDLVVEVALRHHDGEYGHARRVRRASSLREREQRRTGWGAVVEVDGNEQIRQRTPRNGIMPVPAGPCPLTR